MYEIAELSNVAIKRGDFDNALDHIETILEYLGAGNSLDGAEDPFLVYLICYRELDTKHDNCAETF
jgi:hypothetical protein